MPRELVSDAELESLRASGDPEIARLAAEVRRLRAGIRWHQTQTGHALCWLNDLELWRLLEPGAEYPHRTLPARDEFLAQCGRYHESRLKELPYREPEPRETLY